MLTSMWCLRMRQARKKTAAPNQNKNFIVNAFENSLVKLSTDTDIIVPFIKWLSASAETHSESKQMNFYIINGNIHWLLVWKTSKVTYFPSFRVEDIDCLLNEVESSSASISDMIIDDNRRRHVTILMSERGSWTTEASSSLGLEAGGKSSSRSLTAKTLGSYQNRLLKRSIKRSKSVINMFISTSDSKDWENTKAKNITQVIQTRIPLVSVL